MEVSYSRDQLEPLFDLERGIQLKYQSEQTPALVTKVAEFGMSSEELAQACAEYIAECAGRIRGVGNDQYYDGGHQKFETMELDELLQGTLEEIQDIANYATFLHIRIRRIQEALRDVDDLGQGSDEEFEQTDYSVEDFNG
jgi:hypothetical protein